MARPPRDVGQFAAATDGLDGMWSPPEGLHLLGQDRSRRPSRRFFALAGPGLIDTAQEWTRHHPQLLAASRDGSGDVTPELIDYLDADIASLRRIDDGHGGLLVMRAARHQLALAIDLLRDSRYSRREHLNRGIGRLGDDPSRDRIRYGLCLAHALSDAAHPNRADLEPACHEAGHVLPMMTTVSSARCRRLLDVVVARLRPHRTAAVRALLARAEEHRGAEL